MYKIYKVSQGDTLESIAKKFNTTVKKLREINGKEYIIMGELIIVPNTIESDIFDMYVVQKGDNLYSIAGNYNISVNDLLSINGLDKDNYIYPGQEILVPKENINFIITKKDDTIRSASEKLGTNMDDLMAFNESIFLVPEQLLVYRR
jgi:LysM repeat protein